MMYVSIADRHLHPAADWAMQVDFGPMEVDCTTTVVLKIIDNKCKMLPGEKTAVLAVYDVVKGREGVLFDSRVHDIIDQARNMPDVALDGSVQREIHTQRVEAEALIPKPTMKAYKSLLREGLFG